MAWIDPEICINCYGQRDNKGANAKVCNCNKPHFVPKGQTHVLMNGMFWDQTRFLRQLNKEEWVTRDTTTKENTK